MIIFYTVECVRLKAATGNISRICQSDYKLPDSELVLKKGTEVMIPACAIHLDPQHFPDPEYFDPDRFLDNHYKSSSTYFPFGMGPRMCIGRLHLNLLLYNVFILKHTLQTCEK